jgi:hypothetical protein
MIISAPIKPNMTALHLRNPTFSFKINADNNVTIMGAIKANVSASARDITDIE